MSNEYEPKRRAANFPAYPFPGVTMLENDCESPSDFKDCYRIADEMIAARG